MRSLPLGNSLGRCSVPKHPGGRCAGIQRPGGTEPLPPGAAWARPASGVSPLALPGGDRAGEGLSFWGQGAEQGAGADSVFPAEWSYPNTDSVHRCPPRGTVRTGIGHYATRVGSGLRWFVLLSCFLYVAHSAWCVIPWDLSRGIVLRAGCECPSALCGLPADEFRAFACFFSTPPLRSR